MTTRRRHLDIQARISCSFLCFLAALVAALGCDQRPTTVTVHGKVSYRGEPLPKGGIVFYPEIGRPVFAEMADDGQYRVELEPGEYVVTASYGTELPPDFKEGDPMPPTDFVLPRQYTSRVQSTLNATISPDQSEPIDFRLE